MEKILIVDDDKDMRWNLSNILKAEGYNVIAAGDGKKAITEVENHFPSMVFLDIRLPDMDGIQILERIKKIDKDIVIIMITAYGDVKGAVSAMKLGAFDYIVKPFDNEKLTLVVKNALKAKCLSFSSPGQSLAIEKVKGESPQIKQVLNQVKIIAPTNMTVILQGESGTGKELIAQMIHQNSLRKDGPFLAIDCGTLPETLAESELFGYERGAFTGADGMKKGEFELSSGGTLFLDEITNLSISIQKILLRVMQEKTIRRLGGNRDIKIDTRIIAATNTIVAEEVRNGKFREDLFHRLNEFCINIPPLRERKEDIPLFAKYFLEEANSELKKKVDDFSAEAMESLLNYNWPGNVRELRNVIRASVLLADSNYITEAHLPLEVISGIGISGFQKYLEKDFEEGASLSQITRTAIQQIERDIIKKALAQAKNNKTMAAKILKIDRMTLYSKMRYLDLE